MGAYHDALREEGSRSDLLTALEKEWEKVEKMEADVKKLRALEAAGVDNWEGYEMALDYSEEEGFRVMQSTDS